MTNFMKIKEASQALQLKRDQIYDLVKARKLKAFRPGGKILYFDPEDLEAYIRNGQV